MEAIWLFLDTFFFTPIGGIMTFMGWLGGLFFLTFMGGLVINLVGEGILHLFTKTDK